MTQRKNTFIGQGRNAWRTLWRTIATAGVLAGCSLHAQTADSSTVQIPGLNCNFNLVSWSMGAESNPVGGTAAVGPLTLIKAFDACSTLLFRNVVMAVRIPSLTLTHSKNNVPTLTISLTNATVSQFVLGSSPGGPTESIGISYQRISIKNNFTGATFCWDVKMQASCS